jgi:hypothetical protein
LAKWDAALYTDKILASSAREQMWSPVKLNNGKTYDYGFGWYLDAVGSHKLVRHGGSLPGFRAEFVRFVGDKISIIILANGDNSNLGPIALGVANHYIPGLIPKRAAVKIDPKILDAYAGQYQPNPSTVLTVAREGDKLLIRQGSDTEERELLPETETDFFIADNPRLTYRFIKDKQGQVTHLTLQAEGREVGRAKKTK